MSWSTFGLLCMLWALVCVPLEAYYENLCADKDATWARMCAMFMPLGVIVAAFVALLGAVLTICWAWELLWKTVRNLVRRGGKHEA